MSLLRFILEEFASLSARPSQEDEGTLYLSAIGYRDNEQSIGVRWLLSRGIDMRDHGDSLRLASEDAQESRRETVRRYRSTTKGKVAQARYQFSEKGREVARARHRRNDARRDWAAFYAKRKARAAEGKVAA